MANIDLVIKIAQYEQEIKNLKVRYDELFIEYTKSNNELKALATTALEIEKSDLKKEINQLDLIIDETNRKLAYINNQMFLLENEIRRLNVINSEFSKRNIELEKSVETYNHYVFYLNSEVIPERELEINDLKTILLKGTQQLEEKRLKEERERILNDFKLRMNIKNEEISKKNALITDLKKRVHELENIEYSNTVLRNENEEFYKSEMFFKDRYADALREIDRLKEQIK